MEPALTLEMRPAVSPALLTFMQMLALSSADLEGLVARELSENPALERAETAGCPFCGSGNHAYCCPASRGPRPAVSHPAGSGRDGDPAGPETWIAPRAGAQELLEEIRWCTTAGEALLAEYLIGSLDERGFLPGGPAEVAAGLGVPVAAVNQALEMIRRVGPPAIGARDVRESLLLQLDALTTPEPLRELARAIADAYLEPLARGRADAIGAALGSSPDEIAAAVRYIRRHCTPFPAPGLHDQPGAAAVPAVPDVVITRRPGGGLRVEVVEPARLALRISPGYEQVTTGECGDEAREHAEDLLQRASSFLSRLDERHRTMRQVVEHAAERQRDFVLRGPRYLAPLAQADVAHDLGIHESTVSRAVGGKYMMLPSRGVVPVQDFFRAALAPQDAIRQLVDGENHPLTDADLARLLRRQGFRVARRTVAKYRQALGIVAAPLRGSALAPAAKLASRTGPTGRTPLHIRARHDRTPPGTRLAGTECDPQGAEDRRRAWHAQHGPDAAGDG